MTTVDPQNTGDTENKALYRHRFADREAARDALWGALCGDFFQRYVPRSATVLDVAAGYCEFINNIRAGHKYAIDLNPDVVERARPGVHALIGPSTDMAPVESNTIDVAFVSNLFEHLTRPEIVQTLREVRRVLRPGG